MRPWKRAGTFPLPAATSAGGPSPGGKGGTTSTTTPPRATRGFFWSAPAAVRRRRSFFPLTRIGPFLKAYLLLDSRERRGEGYFREGEVWVYREWSVVDLACPPVRLSLDEVYEGVL